MRTGSGRIAAALIVLVALATASCSSDEGGDPQGLGPTQSIASLRQFASCDDLLAELKALAADKVGPYGFGGGMYYGDDVLARTDGGVAEDAGAPVMTTTGAALPATGGDEMDAGTDYSGTNNQEAGVDEADTVKTDGTRLLVLRNGTLVTVDVSDPASPVRRARLDLIEGDQYGGSGSMVLSGDRVLVLLDRWVEPDQPTRGGAAESDAIYPAGAQVTDMIVVSIADLAAPKVLDRVSVEGGVVAARLVGDAARVVVRSAPLGFSWVYPQGPAGEAAAEAANRQIIADSTLDDWLPHLTRDGDTSLALDCADVYIPEAFAGLGVVSVHTVPLADRVELLSTGVVAESETVYASPDFLYVTAAEWVDPQDYTDPDAWEELQRSYRTDIHAFAIDGPQATYEASGQVRGHPLNQYAMSEQDGLLRIATTDGPPWGSPVPIEDDVAVAEEGDPGSDPAEEPAADEGSTDPSGGDTGAPAPDDTATAEDDATAEDATANTVAADPPATDTTVPDTTVPDTTSTTVPDTTSTTTAPSTTTPETTVPDTSSTSTTVPEATSTTTTPPSTTVPDDGDLTTSESFLSVFEQRLDRLVQVGQVGGMGQGEMIRSVRFDGDTAYVVTFRQTDPFYVVDLSDPTAPRLAGELKIPGYSGYLHPLGEGRVLGVGSDATEDGRITGLKVSLFDVSDPAAPAELSTWRMENGNTDVEWDAKAFLWWAATRLAVLPVNDWGAWNGAEGTAPAQNRTGAVGLRVTDAAIEPVGTVSHDRTADRGATECTTVTAEQIAEAGFDDYVGPDTLVIACGEGQAVTATGYSCSVYDREMLDSMQPPGGGELPVPDGTTIGVCYPDPVPVVQRSIVIGDRLLTLTERDLLSSDLSDLAPGRFVDL